jgi:hypothetical protein
MIKNEHQLNAKEKELTNLIVAFLKAEKVEAVEVIANFSKPPLVEFTKGNAIMLAYQIKPEEVEPPCEEQLHITNNFFEYSEERELFERLMTELTSFCLKHGNMPIVFVNVVNSFKRKLESYGGKEHRDGEDMAISPEEWKEKRR